MAVIGHVHAFIDMKECYGGHSSRGSSYASRILKAKGKSST